MNIDYLRMRGIKIPNRKHQIIYPVKLLLIGNLICYYARIRYIHRKVQSAYLTGQVNLKFQYPMSKTFNTVGTYRITKSALPVIIPFGTNVDRSFVWNFEFGSLGFV